MSVLYTVLHATAFVRNDPRRDARQLWPTNTIIGSHDIVVAGRSLSDLARERRTPCVLIAPTTPTAAHPDGDAHVTLVVARITAREEPERWHRDVTLTVDCDLSALIPLVTHIELLHSPHAHDLMPAILRSGDERSPLRARLPKASSPGDLVVFTCLGTLALSQVSPRDRTAARADDAEEPGGSCRKYGGGPFAD